MSSMLRKKAKQLVQSVQGGTDRWVSWIKGTAFKVVAVLLLGTLQLWLSLFLYGSFYYAYMPTVAHINPVYLQFSSCKEFDPQMDCPFPSANATLLTNPDMGNLLKRGQRYRVMLELDMPQSPVNENQGVFMVRLDMYAAGGEIIGSSSRPAMMHYQSRLLKTIQTLFFIPFLLTGHIEEKQVLSVNLMENFVDNPYKPVIGASIQLQARKLEMYSSVLKIQAYFSGLRYLMYQWPLSTALVFITTIFFFLSLITVVSWQQCASAFSSQEEDTVVRMEDVYSVAYEERRTMIRKSMATERSALFKDRPKNVTVISQQGFQDDQESQSSGVSSTYTGGQGSSIVDTIKLTNGHGSYDGRWGVVTRKEQADDEDKEKPQEGTLMTNQESGMPVVEAMAGNSAGEEVLEEVETNPVEEVGREAEDEIEDDQEDSEGMLEVFEEAAEGPSVLDGEELRQRTCRKNKDPDNNNI